MIQQYEIEIEKTKQKTSRLHHIQNTCISCLMHWWFLAILFSSIIVSSLPRSIVIFDFILNLIIYYRNQKNIFNYPKSLQIFSYKNIENFNFSLSMSDFLLISLLKTIILFFCYAYRYQKKKHVTSVIISATTITFYSTYILAKLFYIKFTYRLLQISLILNWLSFIIFLYVQKKKIQNNNKAYISNIEYKNLLNKSSKQIKKVISDLNSPKLLTDKFHSKFIKYNNVNIHYKYYCCNSKYCLIFLHGFIGCSLSWSELINSLTEKYNILIYDRPGFGFSTKLYEANNEDCYSMSFNIDLLSFLINNFALKNSIIISHSIGGLISYTYCLKNPKGILGLINVCFTNSLPNLITDMINSNIDDDIIDDILRIDMSDLLLNMSFYNQDLVTDKIRSNYKSFLELRNPNDSLIDMVRGISKEIGKFDLKSVKSISCPVLMIFGENDIISDISKDSYLFKYLKKYIFKKLPKCGHLPIEECPEKLCDEINSFLRFIA